MEIQAAYEEALRYLYDQLPMFSKLGKDAIKKDLVNIRKLCEVLNNPHEQFKSIHIAGTNGKGSTSHMLAAILQQAGYKVGLYTSPHLVDFRERIRIDGQPVSKEWVVDFVSHNKAMIETIEPSFFEITVAMAFKAFEEQKVDFAVIETGLGGRLDSTNIITPVLSIITNISYDHKDVLGNTLKEIAAEKAGIIKPHIPVLIGEQHEETASVFFETAVHRQSTVYYAESAWDLVKQKQDTQYQYFKVVHKAHREILDLKTDLLGSYQYHNIRTVLAATDLLNARQELNIAPETITHALSRVKQLTGLHGRWEILQQRPLIIADVAHNPAGIKEVMKQWDSVQATNRHIVVGFVRDKDIEEALSFFPKDSVYHFCNASIPRALPVQELSAMAIKAGLQGKAFPTVSEAVNNAISVMKEDDALLIAGSFFVVGEALQKLRIPQADDEVAVN